MSLREQLDVCKQKLNALENELDTIIERKYTNGSLCEADKLRLFNIMEEEKVCTEEFLSIVRNLLQPFNPIPSPTSTPTPTPKKKTTTARTGVMTIM
jgi:hypothetical protein